MSLHERNNTAIAGAYCNLNHNKFLRYLEAKKKKHKKAHEEEKLDFPGHEKIKFGDIVQAPPKLAVTPKVKYCLKFLASIMDQAIFILREMLCLCNEGIQECSRCFTRETSTPGYRGIQES